MAERDARQLTHPHRRAWVEVDTGAIRRNLERIRHLVGRGVRVIPMVKCDGYGLGVENVVAALAPARPLGYGDGLPLALANRGWGIAVGHGVPVVGRISMDTTVVRILGNTAPGDVVTFLGRDDGTELTLEEVAELAGTTGHQLLTGLSARLPRIRVESW